MVGLTLNANLQGVTGLKFSDGVRDPYLYTFRIKCKQCLQVHPKEITINLYQTCDMPDGESQAHFVFKCKLCGTRSSITMAKTNNSYNASNSGRAVRMLDIDARGIEFVYFVPDGVFKCVGERSGTKYDNIDLRNDEWHGYDRVAGRQVKVSITNVEWAFTRK